MTANWVDRLNSSNSRLDKELVLKQALTAETIGDYSSAVFLSLLRVCYDPFITFGIKQISETVGLTDKQNPWDDFNVLLSNLHTRTLTGNNARLAIEEMSQRFDSHNWNTLCAPVIKKDLRAGIQTKSINRGLSGTKYEIPIFQCQLATSCEGRPEMKGIKRLEPKLDGVRVLMIVKSFGDHVTVTSYSRNGIPFETFNHIEHEVATNLSGQLRHLTKGGGAVLDGEVVGHSFQELMRKARRGGGQQADDSVFHVFDIIPLAEFNAGKWNTPLGDRLEMLNKMQPTINRLKYVCLLDSIMVDLDKAEGHDCLDRYAHDMVESGFEGIMIKNLDAPYICSRNTSWLKWKPTVSVDLKVIDVEEGTGRNNNKLGALVCRGLDHGKEISVNVGGGFSDRDRTDLWADRDLVIGRTIEILCDSISMNKDGTYSLRFPRFLRFRPDKD